MENKKTAKAAPKTAAKKTTTKRTTRAKKEKKELTTDVIIQVGRQEILANDVVARVKETYVNGGHRLGAVKSLQIYIKPEENAAYYVANQKISGKIDLV